MNYERPSIPEADWKRLRKLLPGALDRFSRRVLDEIAAISADAGKTNHERYVEVFRRMETRQEELSDAVDDLRRSTAFWRLAAMRDLGLITDKEFAGFSADTRQVVELILR